VLFSVARDAGTTLVHSTTELSIIFTAPSCAAAIASMIWSQIPACRQRTKQLEQIEYGPLASWSVAPRRA
jgi:hypothetical protein